MGNTKHQNRGRNVERLLRCSIAVTLLPHVALFQLNLGVSRSSKDILLLCCTATAILKTKAVGFHCTRKFQFTLPSKSR